MRTTLLLLVAAGITFAADETSPDQKQAAELVKQLGHPKYTVREAAAKRLLELGPTQLPRFWKARRQPTKKCGTVALPVLPQAKAVEWKRRSAAFLADTGGKQKHELPLLADWEKLVGKLDAGSRRIFADMIRADGELLEGVAADRKKAAKLCSDRCKIILAEVRTAKGQIKADPGRHRGRPFRRHTFADALRLVEPGIPLQLAGESDPDRLARRRRSRPGVAVHIDEVGRDASGRRICSRFSASPCWFRRNRSRKRGRISPKLRRIRRPTS